MVFSFINRLNNYWFCNLFEVPIPPLEAERVELDYDYMAGRSNHHPIPHQKHFDVLHSNISLSSTSQMYNSG